MELLKERAKQNGRSMEQEAREILGQRAADLAGRRVAREKVFADLDELHETIPAESRPTTEKVEEWCAIARGRRRGE